MRPPLPLAPFPLAWLWLPAAVCLLAPVIGAARAATAAEFVVIDQRAQEELGETTRLYIDGTLVATIHLDQDRHEARVPVSVPDRAGPSGHAHDYALCGDITVLNRDGGREVHEVSAAGTLIDPAGHTFLALGARDFTRFYLADPTDPDAVRVQPGRSGFCQAPVS